jgi:hypothetical protein
MPVAPKTQEAHNQIYKICQPSLHVSTVLETVRSLPTGAVIRRTFHRVSSAVFRASTFVGRAWIGRLLASVQFCGLILPSSGTQFLSCPTGSTVYMHTCVHFLGFHRSEGWILSLIVETRIWLLREEIWPSQNRTGKHHKHPIAQSLRIE